MNYDIPGETALWQQLEDEVLKVRGGPVGIEKILGGGRRGEARAMWTGKVRACVSAVADVAAVRNTGDVRFDVGGSTGVGVYFFLGQVRITSGHDELFTTLGRSPAAVIMSEWAYATWGAAWGKRLDRLVPKRTVVHEPGGALFSGLKFIAQDPAGVGPYLSASTREMALRGGQAEDLGDDGVRRAIQTMQTDEK